MSVIDIKGLHKSFGDLHILKGIDLTIETGKVVVIIGPSGSGKSTLLRCINFLEYPDAGEIRVNGELIDPKASNLDKVRQHMGMVFQQFQLFPHKNVLHNVTIAPINVKGITHKKANAVARDLLAKVGLPDKE
ncbi:MAG: ATP-binding cassette domain-containing protein, partial [Actinobacteria bacterium]|nr:ATP-binding cassette domain-containing protein [Actinomycetota bacterium]